MVYIYHIAEKAGSHKVRAFLRVSEWTGKISLGDHGRIILNNANVSMFMQELYI